MKNLLLFLSACLIISCNSNSHSPKGVVNAFFEAVKKGDIDGIKKYITSDDAAMIDGAQKLAAAFDSSITKSIKDKMNAELKEKSADMTYVIKDEKINGETATVNAEITRAGKTETHPIELKKEAGEWKISLITTGLSGSGKNKEEMEQAAKEMREGMNELKNGMDSIAGAFKEAGKAMDSAKKELQQKGINIDDLKKELQKEKQQ